MKDYWLRPFVYEVLIAALVISVIYRLMNRNAVKDEREKLIELKALRTSNNMVLYTIVILMYAKSYLTGWSVVDILAPVMIVSMVGETLGIFYYRRKL